MNKKGEIAFGTLMAIILTVIVLLVSYKFYEIARGVVDSMPG